MNSSLEKIARSKNRLEKSLEKGFAQIDLLREKDPDMSGKYNDKIREIEMHLEEEIDKANKVLSQVKAAEELKENRLKEADRKARTRRLIQVGAAFESGTKLQLSGEEDLNALIIFLQKTQFGEKFTAWRNGRIRE